MHVSCDDAFALIKPHIILAVEGELSPTSAAGRRYKLDLRPHGKASGVRVSLQPFGSD